MDDWQVQDDLRTLARAREIKQDPKRMAAVKKLAEQQMVAAAAAAASATDTDD
jgi:uncharacterized protein with GYD domain